MADEHILAEYSTVPTAEPMHFDRLRLGLASPDQIRKWSRGEVKKPETINYRTFKPEPEGLFCEKIFGPTRDWECHCGTYRKIKYRGIVCDRCGVEVTRAKVRREWMGHIELAAPVSHIWYLKGVPSPLGLLLDIAPKPLERVIYFASYVVTHVDHKRIESNLKAIVRGVEGEIDARNAELAKNKAALESERAEQLVGVKKKAEQEPINRTYGDRIQATEDQIGAEVRDLEAALDLLLGTKRDGAAGLSRKDLLTENSYRQLVQMRDLLVNRFNRRYETLFRAGMGADAIRDLLRDIDLDELSHELHQQIHETHGPKQARSVKRLEIVEGFRKSGNRPEWMVMDAVPVIPPELRPMVQLDGGRFATSDLNDLYRRIINRNNRLKKIIDLEAPESIVNHEKRLLQEAVDALIDNGRRARPVLGSNNRPLRSLSDMLKGKEGRFRKNLLGKRVDYSGRSVIVSGPHLKFYQCGLPKEMALELFKPFVMRRLVEKGYTSNIKTAKRMVERMRPEVWDALEEVTRGHAVMLNRAPTLHRLGIQAFEPVLVEGKAIQIHPLVCPPFNADFDGDQMAVHVPLSAAAQAEARVLMLSSNNLFSPAHGRPIVAPTRDIVLGLYYLTQHREGAKGEGRVFATAEEALFANEHDKVDVHARVQVRMDGVLTKTTVGRVIFNQILPPKLRYFDKVADSGVVVALVEDCYRHYGQARTVQLLDDLKELGFRTATEAGITFAITDMDIDTDRERIVDETEKEVARTNALFEQGIISAGERESNVCDLWTRATDQVAANIMANVDPFNPIFMMANSGARGSMRQITQLSGMRGLMTDPFGKFIEDLPIKSNFHEGLDVLEYFVSTHGARKGLADTALRTADAGYLTRRLVDVAQDVIINSDDCGTTQGIWVKALRPDDEELEDLRTRIDGRTAWYDITDPFTDTLLVLAGAEISDARPGPCPDCAKERIRVLWCPACDWERTEKDLQGMADKAIREAQEKAEKQRVELAMMQLQAGLQSGSPEAEEEPDDEEAVLIEGAENGEPADEAPRETPRLSLFSIPMPELPGIEEDSDSLPKPMQLSQPERCLSCGGEYQVLYQCPKCKTRITSDEEELPLARTVRVAALAERILGLAASQTTSQAVEQDLRHPGTGDLLLAGGRRPTETELSQLRKLANSLREKGALGVGEVPVRSPMYCALKLGCCAQCYGRDLATWRRVEVGEAVGIIAAQSIGEPGTQLTMRTFHTGGVAGQYLTGVAEVKKRRQETLKQVHEDIRRGIVRSDLQTTGREREQRREMQQVLKVLEEPIGGLLRVVELVEARRPKGKAIVSEVDGYVPAIETRGWRWVVIHSDQPVNPPENIIGERCAVEIRHPKTNKVIAKKGTELKTEVVARLREAAVPTVTIEKRHLVPYRGYLKVKEGQTLEKGDPLTEGPLDPQQVLRDKGLRSVQEYLVQEIQRVYRSQDVVINDKHIEIIVRQMLRRQRVLEPGDTELLPGQIVDRFVLQEENDRIVARKGRPGTAEWVLLGITEASLATDSFLSAASFQKTTRVLTDAAIKGKVDRLAGLKENVIIGRLIPAGTGMPRVNRIRVDAPGEERIPTPVAAEELRAKAAELGRLGPGGNGSDDKDD